MRAKVTQRGLVIPTSMLDHAQEVEIRKKGDRVVVSLLPARDPIADLGMHPVDCGVPEASEQHDLYKDGRGS